MGFYKTVKEKETLYFIRSGKRAEYTAIPENAERAVEKARELTEKSNSDDLSTIANKIFVTLTPDNKETEIVPSGIYRYVFNRYAEKEYLVTTQLRQDNAVDLSGTTKKIVDDIQGFLNNKKLYEQVGVTYKRGILMYGKPGEGKTTLIRQLIRDSVLKDAIVILCGSVPSKNFLKELNDNPGLKVFIFEELVNITSDARDLVDLLDFLDGEASVNNSITIGTTNVPEQLPANIADRPNRFDLVYEIKSPTEEDRAKLIEFYLKKPATPEEVKLTKDYSSASIKEICMSSLIMQISFADAIKIRKEQSDRAKTAFAAPKGKLGL